MAFAMFRYIWLRFLSAVRKDGGTLEGQPAGEQLEENDAESPYIRRTSLVHFSLNDLGRDVLRSPAEVGTGLVALELT